MMDFDLPTEWLEKREPFFDKPFDERKRMLEELRSEITPEIVIQEIHRYVESESRYADAADELEVEERARQLLVEARARSLVSQSAD
jgi:hypothetical protein